MRRRIIIGGGTLIVLIAIAGLTLNTHGIRNKFQKRLERGWLMLNGGLVDVGGHRLRVERFGKGSPTVVLETGLAQDRYTWRQLPKDIADFTEVVIYDRAGLGESYSTEGPRTSAQIVADLRAMLKNAGVPGPYVFVGHSFGGFNVRLYASRYPDEVAGMVLIDASHEDEFSHLSVLLPPDKRAVYLEHESGLNYEQVNLLASAGQVRASAALKEMPFIVISVMNDPQAQVGARGKNNDGKMPCLEGAADVRDCGGPRAARIHTELQNSLVRLVPNGIQIIAENSGHFVHWDRPEIVTSAVRKVVDEVRPKLAGR